MEPEKILHELTYADGLPREALKAASAQRVEMIPLFLEEIETYLALEPAARVKPTPLFFIFHLFGEWREKAAYRPLARLLRLPRRDVDAIFGDGITTTSHRVMRQCSMAILSRSTTSYWTRRPKNSFERACVRPLL